MALASPGSGAKHCTMLGSRALALFLVLLPALAAALPACSEPSAAVLGFTLIDTSTEGDIFGPRADETARIDMLGRRLEEAFEAQGYTVVDVAPVAERVAEVLNIARSNGLDAKLARELGADLAVTGEVQKVSNLIITMNVIVRRAADGAVLRAGNADIRSNTDRSWTRGLDYVLENRIFDGGPIAPD